MENRSYSSLNRYGLGSSYSHLDGVPFKIALSFRQPQKISVSTEISNLNVSRVHNEEYSFETEEAVLAWAHAREEAFKQAAKECTEQLASGQQDRKLVRTTASHSGDSVTDENVMPKAGKSSGLDQKSGGSFDSTKTILSSTQNCESMQEKPRMPKVLAARQMCGLDLLKPIPAQSASFASASKPDKVSDSGSRFDISVFESEADLFENLELQAINDMEELKILLDSSASSSLSNGSRPQML